MEIVNGFWIGKIGHMEELTMKSFMKNNADFVLWSYEKKIINLPENVVLKDANEILAYKEVFKYPKKMNTDFGENSYVGTSEIFRYKLLYEKGGWWTDMDVTCLKPINEIQEEFFFRHHGNLIAAGNIMKCPPKSQLMFNCYNQAKKTINQSCVDWFMGMNILCDNINDLRLNKYIQFNKCNLDKLSDVYPLIKGLNKIPDSWNFIHWMNTIIQKNFYKNNSAFSLLLKKYNCKTQIKTF